ncbi:hypothetical protein Pelo_10057 [Pelomyxa schiedti]|nr:hypothetical protein Pelo_10057 [Pelomyxa schiedti]
MATSRFEVNSRVLHHPVTRLISLEYQIRDRRSAAFMFLIVDILPISRSCLSRLEQMFSERQDNVRCWALVAVDSTTKTGLTDYLRFQAECSSVCNTLIPCGKKMDKVNLLRQLPYLTNPKAMGIIHRVLNEAATSPTCTDEPCPSVHIKEALQLVGLLEPLEGLGVTTLQELASTPFFSLVEAIGASKARQIASFMSTL